MDWHPWGDEAFERARREDKPVFLSIGYATCHWCHVMAHESFEDPVVAELLNDGFVSIKLDREERPDIDSVYMTVCQLMTGQGGWPLSIFMTPDKRPFFAGTYFPREGRGGRPGMLEMLPRLRALWEERRDELERSADAALDAVREIEERATSESSGGSLGARTLAAGFDELAGRFDRHQGGFGRAPRFPTPHQLLFLLRWHDRDGNEAALEMVETTLTMMRRGGIYDHVGFGFHRYSTDARWLVPHFEKMLYDQALLVLAYVETWEVTGKRRYRRVAEEVLEYVRRDLTDERGGFCSAEDADSEGREGAFYVWTRRELDDTLDDEDAALVRDLFRVEARGNFAEESTGRRTGENILHRTESLSDAAERRKVEESALRDRLDGIRERLLEARETRPRPLLDDKVLTDWNGLMIAALSRAGRAFDEPRHTATARRAAEFVLSELRRDGRLLHRYREGDAAIEGGAADYAFLAWGLIELYESTFELRWLEEARSLVDGLLSGFWDDAGAGVFNSAADVGDVPVRQKETYDGATPSANATTWYVLRRLAALTGDVRLLERAERLASAFAGSVAARPSAHTMWLVALDLALGPGHEVVISGDPEAEDTGALVAALRRGFRPRTAVLLRPTGAEERERLARLAPFTRGQDPLDGAAAAYVCSNFECRLPTSDPAEMVGALEADADADAGGGPTGAGRG